MQKISNLLEKFKKLLGSSVDSRRIFIDSVKNIINIELDPKSVEIKDVVAYIKGGSSLRNELFFNKERILENVNKLLPVGKKIKEIK